MIKLKPLLEQTKRWCAVVIDEKSRNTLLATFKSQIPDGWEIIAHHMTINFKGISDEEGTPVTLKVVAVGLDDMACAVKVEGYQSTNAIPHITLAINKQAGAKPKNSNDIKNWQPVQNSVSLTGVVENL